MFLHSIEYSQFENTPQEWKLSKSTFGNINLIVGMNTAGKSFSLNIINGLSNLVSGDKSVIATSGNYDVLFSNENQKIEYILKYEHGVVLKEILCIDSNPINPLLERGPDGMGKIYYEKEKKILEFQTPQNELASVNRRDSLQHSFLEELYNWGKSVRLYYFGTQLGKEVLAVLVKRNQHQENEPAILNLKDTNQVVAIFRKAQKEFPKSFNKLVIDDMKSIGYYLTEIGIAPLESLVIRGNIPGEIMGLYVQEKDLKGKTDQINMSQGMFRALSLIVQITYSQLADVPSCILIDDIGEGLDYERSSALVKLLVNKAKNTKVQLIMSTNDRFIMNNVPLEYWSVIYRKGGTSTIYNYQNSKELFDSFQLTGLNNFDFFSSDYLLKELAKK